MNVVSTSRLRASIVISILSVALAPVSRADSPTDPGSTLVQQVCTQCHSLAPIKGVRDGMVGWRNTVYKMVQTGAQVRTPAEVDTIVEFLAATYGPAAGPMHTGVLPPDSPIGAAGHNAESVVLPSGNGVDLVKASCSVCHDLGRVVGTRRSAEEWRRYTKGMLARGGFAPTKAVTEAIDNYLSSNFGAVAEPKSHLMQRP